MAARTHTRMAALPSRAALGALVGLAAVLASCQKGDSSGGFLGKSGLLGSAARAESQRQDPCTLLTSTEATPYVGPLTTPPYRVDYGSGAPEQGGDGCMYRGKDRQVQVMLSAGGGEMLGRTLSGVPQVMNKVLGHDSAAAGMTTMVNRVMSHGPAGPWDNATWIPGGSLTLTKGNTVVMINMAGASGSESDAYNLAREMMPRLGHPLDYDGAKAVALAPKPRAHPANPCDFLPRSVAEAAIGPLSGPPTADDSTTCTYHVATAQGERSYPVAFAWQNGLEAYNRMKHGMAMLGGLIGVPTSTPLDTMKPNAGMGQMLGGLMKMVGGGAGKGGAPGAVTKVGFQTDTALVGPWDNASLLHGTQLLAVRHDVLVAMDLSSADYDKAKALLSAICRRL